MGGTSTAVMTFVKADLLDNVRENKEDGIWSGMRNSSLKVEPVSPLNYHTGQYLVCGLKFN